MVNANKRRVVSGHPAFFCERGLALVLVIFVVALTTILVVNLAYSTYLSSRSLGMVERQLQAEYMLKSLVNFSAGLIKEDSSPAVDAPQDPWGLFLDGQEIPASLLGITDPGIRIYLEINPTNSKLRVSTLKYSSGNPSSPKRILADKCRDYFYRLFKILLNSPKLIEMEDHLGIFSRTFTIEDMVANLIDYIDQDQEPYNYAGFTGIESPNLEHVFKNGSLQSKRELSRIPGFTPERLQVISPYLETKGEAQININTAGRTVIQALHEDFTPEIAAAIHAYIQNEGPLRSVSSMVGRVEGYTSEVNTYLSSLLVTKSNYFRVVAKVDYESQAPYFLRALLIKYPGNLGRWPKVTDVELY